MDVNNQPAASPYSPVDDEGIDLGELLSVLLEYRWMIVAIVIAALFIGGYKAFVATPVYQADGLLQVEENSGGLRALDIDQMIGTDTLVSAEIEILKSRSVLGAVVDNLKLDINAQPRFFPFIGAALARRAPANERPSIKVDSLEYSGQNSRTPLVLIVSGPASYEMQDADGRSLGSGTVGEALSVDLGGGDSVMLFISALNGEVGQEFDIWRSSRMNAISSLQGRMNVEEQGDWSGILAITLRGTNPRLVQQQLNEIQDVYIRQNVERRSAEAQQTLDFLNRQLPSLRLEVETAERALNEYRLEKGSIDLPLETQTTLQTIVAIEAELSEMRREREKVTLAFTPAHPTVIALDRQIGRLAQQLEDLNSQVRDLPTTQQELLRLIRDVEVNTALYTSLLNTAQELRVVKAGTVGNSRIIDYAEVPTRPVSPNRRRMLLLSFVFGGFIGVVAAFARHALKSGVEDPDLIEKHVNLPVYATVAHSKRQEEIFSDHQANGHSQVLLAADSPDDLAIESLRNLQTALHFGTMDAKNNCIMIAGPSPGVGKSFISANLAAVLTGNGKKVLLIDGDMRQGHLHKFLGLSKENGLSDLISKELTVEQALHATPIEGLTLMPTGNLPPNPAELLFHHRFADSMDVLIPRYDHIIIDSPPILAATDATIIGQVAGATMMVIKSGAHPMREIEQSVKRLQISGVNLRGLVINDVRQSYRYGAGKYAYQYSYASK